MFVVNGKRVKCRLYNDIFVHTIEYNMVSVRTMFSTGKLTSSNAHRYWKSKHNRVLTEGTFSDGLYCVESECNDESHHVTAGLVADVNLWP